MRPVRLVRNAVASYAGRFIGMGINFLLVPFLVRSLGDSGFGIWQLTGSLIAYFFLLDLGISTSVGRYVAKYDAEGLRERVNQIVSTLFFVYCALSVLAVVLAGVLAPLFPHLFHVEANLVPTAQVVFLLAGVNFALLLPTSIFNAILVGYQRIDLNNIAAVVAQIIQLLLIVALLSMGFGLVALASISIAHTLILAAIRLWFIKRTQPHLEIRKNYFQRSVFRSVIGFSMTVFGMQINDLVLYNADNIIIGLFLSTSAVTPFAIVYKLGNFLQEIAKPLSIVFFPAFAELDGLRDPHRAQRLLMTGTKITSAAVFPLAALLLILGVPIICLWTGPAYISAKPTLDLLVLFFLTNAVSRPAWQLLFGFGQIKRFFFVLSGFSLANLLLSALLVRPYGIWGVALGSALPLSIAYIAFLLPEACRVIGLSVREFFLNSLVRPVLALVPAVAILKGLVKVIYPDGIILLGVEAGVFALFYLLFYVTIAMTGEERRRYWQVLSGLLVKVGFKRRSTDYLETSRSVD